MKNLATFLFLLSLSLCGMAQTLSVHITGIRSGSGSIRLAVYTSQAGFEDEKPLLVKTYSKAELKNGQLSVEYKGLAPGTYGIALLDDENNNQKMDYGMILPKEGFGFSDYYHTGMSRPTFDKFDFVSGKENKTVEIKIRYM